MSPKLSILVPIYNEWKTVQELLDRVLELKFEKEILVVDDGSTDGTREILDRIHHPSIRIFRHPANRGKGSAIRTALANSTGDIVIIQDADLEQDPNDIYELVKPIMTQGAQVVYGSRFLGQRPKMHWAAYAANVFLSRFTSFLYGAEITDLETCYKVFSAELIKNIPLTCRGFEFEPEVTAKILRKGIKIYEVPIKEDWYHGYYNNSKKVTWWDGAKAILTLIQYRFRNE